MPGVTTLPSGAADLPGSGASMRRVVIKAGHVAARHHHDYEQFLFVAEGGGRLSCEAGEIALEPGVGLRLDAGAWHEASFTNDTVLIEVNLPDISVSQGVDRYDSFTGQLVRRS